VKRTYIFAAIVPIVLLGTISIQSAAQPATESPATTVDQNAPQQTTPSTVAESNEPAEPNTGPKSAFTKAIEGLETEEQAELREWNSANFERKPRLLRAVNRKHQAQLQMLRTIALEEGAEKTAAAIDELIEKNNQYYEKTASELEDETRQARLQQLREERQQRLEEKRQRREERRQQRQRDREDRNGRRTSRRGDNEH